MTWKNARNASTLARLSPRIQSVCDIKVSYEGRKQNFAARPPNLSAKGMFINTSSKFPEGAILNVHFRLGLSRTDVHARCEVRHCDPGIGIGVEFIEMPDTELHKILREIHLWNAKISGRRSRKRTGRKKMTSD